MGLGQPRRRHEAEMQRIEPPGANLDCLLADVLDAEADAEQHRAGRAAVIGRRQQHLVDALHLGRRLRPIEQPHVPGVTGDRVILKRLQATVGLHALRYPPVEGGVRLALGEVRAEAEPARTHETIVDRQPHEAVHRIPVLVDTVGDIAHHARAIVDLAMRGDRALAIAVHVDVKKLSSAFLVQALGLLARVQDLAANAAMVALQNVVAHAMSFG